MRSFAKKTKGLQISELLYLLYPSINTWVESSLSPSLAGWLKGVFGVAGASSPPIEALTKGGEGGSSENVNGNDESYLHAYTDRPYPLPEVLLYLIPF